jgi:hypothetical protein
MKEKTTNNSSQKTSQRKLSFRSFTAFLSPDCVERKMSMEY